ncbi:MAG: hypothetical protein Q4B28_00685 [bacterium]|nr:hypothetical protein [bacterium]
MQFSINETGEALHQARIAALQEGKMIAQHTADQLGVQLGRLLQTTEYPLASDYYGPQQEQYSVHFYRGDDIAQFKGVDIIRKVYLTYDID